MIKIDIEITSIHINHNIIMLNEERKEISKNKPNDIIKSFNSFEEIKKSRVDINSPKFTKALYNLGFAREDLRL